MRILIRKINSTNTLLSTNVLIENEDVTYSIVENAPEIEERETEIGHYELDADGQLIVVYEPKPKSLEQHLAEQDRIIADLMLEVAMLGGGK